MISIPNQNEVVERLSAISGIRQLWLGGSRARGSCTGCSDYDLIPRGEWNHTTHKEWCNHQFFEINGTKYHTIAPQPLGHDGSDLGKEFLVHEYQLPSSRWPIITESGGSTDHERQGYVPSCCGNAGNLKMQG